MAHETKAVLGRFCSKAVNPLSSPRMTGTAVGAEHRAAGPAHGIHCHQQTPAGKSTQGPFMENSEEDSMGFTFRTGRYGAQGKETGFLKFS